jgi:ribosomal protein S16
MKRKIVIRFAKLRKYSKNNVSKIIVVAYNNSPPNGGHIEKIGTYSKFERVSDKIGMVSTLNLRRLVY